MSQSTKSITSVVFKPLENMFTNFTLFSQDKDGEDALTVVTTDLSKLFPSVYVQFRHSMS